MRAKITHEDFRELASARSATYRFLASIYLNASATELANKLLEGKLTPAFEHAVSVDEMSVDIKDGFQALGRFVASIRDKPVHELAEELAVEWTRLFRGVKRGYGPPPPYESVYGETQRTMGQPATEISNLYADAGAGLSKTLHELPDYIGVELDSMRFMCGKEADAWNTHSIEESANMLQLEGKLLKEHLAVWVPKFCELALEEAKNDFYKAVLRITKGVVLSEAARIDELIATAMLI